MLQITFVPTLYTFKALYDNHMRAMLFMLHRSSMSNVLYINNVCGICMLLRALRQ